MVAARRPGVCGVISAAGPTHLGSLPALTRHLAVAAFGERLRRFSPLAHAPRLDAPVQLQYGHYDRLVPFAQGAALAAAHPGADLLEIPGVAERAGGQRPAGWIDWVHGWVSPRVARAVAERERRWLARHCSARRR
jgi:pimeloyl-ACP methyl ester carboxylesterase